MVSNPSIYVCMYVYVVNWLLFVPFSHTKLNPWIIKNFNRSTTQSNNPLFSTALACQTIQHLEFLRPYLAKAVACPLFTWLIKCVLGLLFRSQVTNFTKICKILLCYIFKKHYQRWRRNCWLTCSSNICVLLLSKSSLQSIARIGKIWSAALDTISSAPGALAIKSQVHKVYQISRSSGENPSSSNLFV